VHHVFEPSQADVRRFFSSVLQRAQQALPLEGAQALAAPWVMAHPAYHPWLSNEAAALQSIGQPATDEAFLHLSMHLAITEQCSIDQPPGVRQAVQHLAQRLGSEHEAHHAAMECLQDVLRNSSPQGKPPDGAAYVRDLRRLGQAQA
jgi:hypothetical protein